MPGPPAVPPRTDEFDHLVPLFDALAALDPRDPARDELREYLVFAHLPLAEHIARRFHLAGFPEDDLFLAAAAAIEHAVDRFDPVPGVDFLSYAIPTILGEVRRAFRDTVWPARDPALRADRRSGRASDAAN